MRITDFPWSEYDAKRLNLLSSGGTYYPAAKLYGTWHSQNVFLIIAVTPIIITVLFRRVHSDVSRHAEMSECWDQGAMHARKSNDQTFFI